jgi:hypothetical protein
MNIDQSNLVDTGEGRRWILSTPTPLRCKGVNPWAHERRVTVSAHVATIKCGEPAFEMLWQCSWLEGHARRIGVSATNHCLRCGVWIELQAAADRRGVTVEQLAVRYTPTFVRPLRDDEERDGVRCIGERMLLSALLIGGLRDAAGLDGVSPIHREEALAWVESDHAGLITFNDVCRYLKLDRGAVRRKALVHGARRCTF